jgi:hypothetical protein
MASALPPARSTSGARARRRARTTNKVRIATRRAATIAGKMARKAAPKIQTGTIAGARAMTSGAAPARIALAIAARI